MARRRARLTLSLPEAAVYRVLVTSADPRALGSYYLSRSDPSAELPQRRCPREGSGMSEGDLGGDRFGRELQVLRSLDVHILEDRNVLRGR